ncbi:MAG TPA: hypothetical protein VGQ25_02625 [Gemmatimonadales bacterium]|nr:hypothetical protein [Gemmatimonadales bacterium]
MRPGVVGLALAALLVGLVGPARAQFSFDARRIGMGGVSLTRDGNLRRYNAAYRAVKDRKGGGNARFTIPVPLGLIKFFRDHPINQLGDDPMFNPDSAAFNPVELVNLVFNAPIFLEVKEAPTPTNDVEFTVGKNTLIIDLGAAQVLIPEDEFGLGGSSRLLDMGIGVKGFRFAVQGFENHDFAFLLGDTLRAFLKEADSARTNTTYNLLGDAIVQAGFAPTLSFSGRVMRGPDPESDDGVYLGAAVRSYYGLAYFGTQGSGGFTTGDTLFAGPNPVTPYLDAFTYRDNDYNKTLGRGVGGDVGVVFIAGPMELGAGVNDIGAELTWKDVKIERTVFDTAGDSLVTTPVANHVERKTKLPVTYIANAAIRMGTGTTIGGDIVNNGRGTVIHVGGEQRFGPLALRGGVSRDQRKKMQFGWGGGVRLGPLGLDLGFWTHSNSFADKRGITMATSISLY